MLDHPDSSVAKFFESRRQEQQLEKAVVRDFVRAAQNDDGMLAWECIQQLESAVPHHWKAVMRAVAKVPHVPAGFRKRFLQFYLDSGDHLRLEVGNDLVWIDALRVLLPPYIGPAIRVYRGDSFYNRCRQTYGASWSSTEDVGRAYAATGVCRMAKGGAILVTTLAPPVAIICAVAKHDDRYDEQEYVVDRRQLDAVHVLERFPQQSHKEWQRSRGHA